MCLNQEPVGTVSHFEPHAPEGNSTSFQDAQRPASGRLHVIAKLSLHTSAFDGAAPFAAPICSDDFGAASYISPPP